MGLSDMGPIDVHLALASNEHEADAPRWRCAFCDEWRAGEPPLEYYGRPCCSDLCLESLMQFRDAAQALERAVSQRNMATIAALIFFAGFLYSLFGGGS